MDSQQAQNIGIRFIQRRPKVSDAGPTLYECYTMFCVCWVFYGIRHALVVI